jgi:hypothetical protein
MLLDPFLSQYNRTEIFKSYNLYAPIIAFSQTCIALGKKRTILKLLEAQNFVSDADLVIVLATLIVQGMDISLILQF